MNKDQFSNGPSESNPGQQELDLDSLLKIDSLVKNLQERMAASGTKIDLGQIVGELPDGIKRPGTLELLLEVWQENHRSTTDLLSTSYANVPDADLIEKVWGWKPLASGSPNLINADWPKVPGYELLEVAGSGGTAVVYKARQYRPERLVAIKVPANAEASGSLRELERLHAEAALQARYQGTAVPAVFEVGLTEGGIPFLAMEFLAGQQLTKYLPSAIPSIDEVRDGVRLVGKICRALAPVHVDGNSHLDLSATNIYVTADDRVKILDFGFGHNKAQVDSKPGHAGTPDYMAPEKARGQSAVYSPATDVFSLGAILARIITSRRLLPSGLSEEDYRKQLSNGDFGDLIRELKASQAERGVPAAIVELTIECLNLDVAKRPRDASIVAQRIEDHFRSEEAELQRLQVENARRLAQEAADRQRRRLLRKTYAVVLGVVSIAAIVSVRYALVARAEQRIASKNVELRLTTLEDVVNMLSEDRLRRTGHTQLQRELLERLLPRFNDVLTLDGRDEATRLQQGLAWNTATVMRQAMHQFQDAQEAARNAELILGELSKKPNALPHTKLAYATALGNSAMLLGYSGIFPEAIGKSKNAVEILTGLIAENEKDPAVRFRIALAQNNWAILLLRSGKLDEAKAHYDESIKQVAVAEQLVPKELTYRVWHAKALSNLVDLYLNLNRLNDARTNAIESVKIAEKLNEEFPKEIDSRECLAVCVTNFGLLELKENHIPECISYFQKALEFYSALAVQVPEFGEYLWGQAMSESNLGAAYLAGSPADLAKAEKHFKTADSIYVTLTKSMPDNQELKGYVDENKARLDEVAKMKSEAKADVK